MTDGVVHKIGTHWQDGRQNSAGPGLVQHTDYVHPVYGYSRFDGHASEKLCELWSRMSYERWHK